MVAVATARQAAGQAAHTAHEREGRGHAVRSSSRGYPRLDLYTAFAVCSMRVEQFNVLLRTPSQDNDWCERLRACTRAKVQAVV